MDPARFSIVNFAARPAPVLVLSCLCLLGQKQNIHEIGQL